MSDFLPQDLERVLYLDCDVIINQSLNELWNIDLRGCTIGALRDAFSSHYRKNIELEPNDIMFNSGVMLVDLKKWKENNIENKVLDFIKRKNGRIQQGDQGALNAVLSKSTYCFEPRFNSVTIFYDFTYEEMLNYRKPVQPYMKEEIQEAVDNPVIIHFTTSFLSERPWVIGSQHRCAEKWLAYKKKCPWKDRPYWKKKKGIMSMYLKLCDILPRKIIIWISSLLQVYARTLYYSLHK